MMIVAITGGIGSGKSLVSKVFAELDAKIIDTDLISRHIMEPDGTAYPHILKEFGEDILENDGRINRKAVAEIVFNNKEKLSVLNSITHKYIFDEVENQIKTAEKNLICLDVPLLFSCDFPFSYDASIGVIAPLETRIERVIKRDGCTREQVIARINNQISDEEIRNKADFCIINDLDEEKVRNQVLDIYRKLTERK